MSIDRKKLRYFGRIGRKDSSVEKLILHCTVQMKAVVEEEGFVGV